MDIRSLLLTKLSVTPWAVHPGMLDVITSVINNKIENISIKDEEVQQVEDVRDFKNNINYSINNGVAVIPIHGIVLKRSMGMQGISGMETTLRIDNTLIHAEKNDKVERILLDIDSPGGTSDGIMETSELIHELGRNKPIDAYANGMTCSAGYWLAAPCRKIYAFGTTEIGSIGVYMMHVDQSKYNDNLGVKITYIKAGKYKVVGNPHEPISESGMEKLQGMVDDVYTKFIDSVARYRGYTSKRVRENMAEGNIFNPEQALKEGLIDEIRNFEGIIDSSNIYSFLGNKTQKRKGKVMFDKKVKDATAEEVKAENEDLYMEIYNEGVSAEKERLSSSIKVVEDKNKELAEENKNLKTENENLKKEIEDKEAEKERVETITKFAAKVNQSDLGEKLVSEGVSVPEASQRLLEASADKLAFEQTAPEAAGASTSDDLDGDEPKDQMEAMKYCQKKYDCSKAQAWKHARRDFSRFFGK